MCISVGFSFVIFEISTNEFGDRLKHFQYNLQNDIQLNNGYAMAPPGNGLRTAEQQEVSANLSLELVYANVAVLIVSGAGAYFLARRTLRPIEKAHEAQSRFTSDASHELRTPLAVMKAELEVTLRDKNSSVEELREVLESNLEEVEKLSRLSEMLLSLSKLDHDHLVREEVDLVYIVNDVNKLFGLKDTRLSFKHPDHLSIEANEAAVRELISIFIDNALKYSPNDSLININIEKKQNFGSFEIANHGAGIAEDKLPHIFDRFYRADTSRTGGEQKGYGLGLALAKQVVQMHNGELSVTSIVNDKTSFNVMLPLYKTTQAKNQK